MKKLSVVAAVALGLVWAASAEACHNRGGGGCSYASDYCAPCAPVSIAYVERVVTAYRQELKEEKVTVNVCQLSWKTVTVPVQVCEVVPVKSQVQQTYYVSVPVTQKQTYYVPVMVPTKHTVMVPTLVPTKQTVTTLVPTPTVVTVNVPVCTSVPVVCVDPCTGCSYTVCRPVMTTQPMQKTVWQCVPVQKDIVVNVCHMTSKDVTVNVCHLQPQVRDITVMQCQPATKMVDVVTYTTQYKTVNVQRQVAEYVTVPQVVSRYYCVSVPYQTTIRVPVCVPVAPCCGSVVAPTAGAAMPTAAY